MQGKMGECEMEDDRYGNRVGGCIEPGGDGDVEVHEAGYWDVGLCTGVGSSGAFGSSVGVDGADGVRSGGGVGGGCGNSDSWRSVGGS